MKLTLLGRLLTVAVGACMALIVAMVADIPRQLDESYAKMTPEQREKHKVEVERLKKIIFWVAVL